METPQPQVTDGVTANHVDEEPPAKVARVNNQKGDKKGDQQKIDQMVARVKTKG